LQVEKYEDGKPPIWLLRIIGFNRPETYIEKCLRQIIYRLGLVNFRHNYYVYACGKHHFIDYGNPFVKIGIECDSVQWHPSIIKDLARDKRLESKGWRILHVCSKDLIHNQSEVENRILMFIRGLK
jgi:very-short-patch-repair endonuclease